ncbi:MAG: hypothetical protein ABI203_05005 [Mucilaginibacter sp.]
MKIRQLSSNLLAEKTVVTLVLIISQPFWIVISDFPAISIILVLILALCGYSLYAIYFIISDISYDENQLYITHRKQQKCIQLSNITLIKITPYWGSWRPQWKVKYVENGIEETTFFYLKYGLISLKPFIKAVKVQNPSVDYVYITLDIDFD